MNRTKDQIYTYTIDYHIIIFWIAIKKGLIPPKNEDKIPIRHAGTY